MNAHDDSATVQDSASTAAPPISSGVAVCGYAIERELGRGGMGVVYLAQHLALNRTVALKMILAGGHAGEADVQRFRTEAEAIARLQHPNIVQIYEVGEQAGLPYFSLEFCSGGALDRQLSGTPMVPLQAAALVETLARAMQVAHEHGIVHRDLNPSNVLLAEDGTPKITDFGLAKKLDEATKTATGAVMGTPSYMAPEQARGQSSQVGPAADVYALGAILYECLTGRPPFKAATALDTLVQVTADEPVSPHVLNPQVPRDLDIICLKCLQKESAKRYRTAADMAEDLGRWRRGEPITARAVGSVERLLKWVRRRPTAAALLLACFVALVALGGGTVGLIDNRELERARRGEEEQRKIAQESLERAENYLYYHRIGLAERSWRENRVARSIELLDECPPDKRGWEWNYLDRLCHAERLVLTDHTGEVVAIAYSPDGKWLATTCRDRKLRLWDAGTGKLACAPVELKGTGWGVAFSHDGRQLAATAEDGIKGGGVGLWELGPIGSGTARLEGRWFVPFLCGGHSAVAFRPDDSTLAVAGGLLPNQVGELQMLAVTDGALLWKKGPPQGHFLSVAFSRDGTRLAAGTGTDPTDRQADGGIVVWDVSTGKEAKQLASWRAHKYRTFGLSFGPDGLLASCGTDRTIRLWAGPSFREQQVLRGHTDDVVSIAFGPDGKQIASVGCDSALRVWDATEGRELFAFRGHSGFVQHLAWHPAGQEIATCGDDGTARLWDVTDSSEAVTLHGHEAGVSCVAFHPTGRLLVSAGIDATVRLWDLAGKTTIRLLRHDQPVWAVAFSPDGRHLATASGDWEKTMQKGQIRVYEVDTGKEIKRLDAHIGVAWKVAFSPDGKRLASAGGELYNPGEIKLWDTATWTETRNLSCEKGVGDVVFSPDGQHFAGAVTLQEAHKMWPLDPAADAVTLSVPGHQAWSLAFGPDGTLLTGHSNGILGIWDTTTAKGRQMRSQSSDILGICFAPDGRRVATAGSDLTIKLWDPRTWQELLTLRGHDMTVRHITFSPNGLRLASCGYEGTIRIWDATPRR